MVRPPPGTDLVAPIGVGSVFLALRVRDAGGRELVAKRIRPGLTALTTEPMAARALMREAEVLRAARGVGLPELVAAGEDEAGGFVVETLAHGVSARQVLREQGLLDARRWMEVARASSQMLADLHALTDAQGPLLIAHGDVSPDNLFLTIEGTGAHSGRGAGPPAATLIDLSSATWRGGPSLVFPDDRGTVPYAAPEVARGERPADRESDTYALAATLLALAVGQITQATANAAMLFEVGTRGVQAAGLARRPDLPTAMRSALTAALTRDRDGRLVSSAELALALAR